MWLIDVLLSESNDFSNVWRTDARIRIPLNSDFRRLFNLERNMLWYREKYDSIHFIRMKIRIWNFILLNAVTFNSPMSYRMYDSNNEIKRDARMAYSIYIIYIPGFEHSSKNEKKVIDHIIARHGIEINTALKRRDGNNISQIGTLQWAWAFFYARNYE